MSMIHPCLSRPLVALLLAGLLTAGPAARAASDNNADVHTVVVATNDLDLASPAGRIVLRHRILKAAAEVCGAFDTQDLQTSSDYDDCRTDALADANVQFRLLIAKVGRATMAVADAGVSRR